MKQRLYLLALLWAVMTAVMALLKPAFMLLSGVYAWSNIAHVPGVLWHGLSMDMSMAGYLTVPVWLWLVASLWTCGPRMMRALRIYLWMPAALIAAAWSVDLILYPYWGFKLDTTPIFYFMSSPASAMASAPWWREVLCVLGIVAVARGLYWVLMWPVRRIASRGLKPVRWTAAIGLLLAGGVLFVAIRGGVTVSTMSPARAFYSKSVRLNHAAVNPLFSLVYSATHADRLATSFRYYRTAGEARERLWATLATLPGADSTALQVRLRHQRPHIYIIVMEGFSAHLMPSLGGRNVAPRLDSIARSGVLFSNFYAESFRTDRALPCILSGYPALPGTSVLKYPSKFDRLPSLARTLSKEGYTSRYFYGGDLDFTNLRAYLVSTGFDQLTGDTDFDIASRLSKWGAPDEKVFGAALADAHRDMRTRAHHPVLRVVQTSSSHEPFDVPRFRRYADNRANAFAYADSCLGAFVDSLRTLPTWNRTLVAIVPDHWGAYPQNLTDPLQRHHVPLVLTGGALQRGGLRIDTPGSQSAIAPTLLAMMGLSADTFYMPRSLLSVTDPQWAWMAEPDWFGMILGLTPGLSAYIPVNVSAATPATGTPQAKQAARAFVQLLYSDLNQR